MPRDEELPGAWDDPRRRRLRVVAGIGALAVLAVAITLRITLGSHGSPGSTPVAQSSPAQPSPAQPSSPTTLGSPAVGPAPETTPAPPLRTADLPSSVPTRHGDDPRACPGHRCRTSVDVPAAVTAAVEDALPESQVETVETVRLTGRNHTLWFRMIEARAASETVEATVEAPARGDRPSISFTRSGLNATTTVATTLGPWHVVVRVLDPTGGEGDVGTMQRLAADPRLVAG